MSIIKRLPPSVTNKIAAGEVVERPSAVVKELLENAVDAGSTQIDIYLLEGGKERIQIIDNGSGIGCDEVTTALERFSTSKIESFEDLEKLSTFGFRGEALASISAVSIMEIKTKTASETEGTLLRCEGGEVTVVSDIPWNKGTSITINNLFYNTPARRKFQKNALSEARQIYRIFRYCALAYPELQLSLHNDGRCIWRLQKADLKHRIGELFSSDAKNHLFEVDFESDIYKVYGFCSVPEYTRSTRNDQFLFLNRRFIKNRSIDHGIYQGYGTTLSHSGGHPFFVMMLDMAPDLFDINIHPTKLEARFRDDRSIHSLFNKAVQKGLGYRGNLISFAVKTPQVESEKAGQTTMTENQQTEQQGTMDIPASPRLFRANGSTEGYASGNQASVVAHAEQRIHEQEKVWQVHNCYIFSQVKSGLIIIDQHVAHERILYEKALMRLHGGEKPNQQLLFPQSVEVEREEIVLINEFNEDLKKLGYEIGFLDERTIEIKAVPLEVRQGREVSTLRNILDECSKDEYKDLAIHEKLAASFACRSSIMKGDSLSPEEMYRLIDDLFATEFPYYCPHGRPTVIDMSLTDIDTQFLR